MLRLMNHNRKQTLKAMKTLLLLFCAVSFFANGQTYKMYTTSNIHNQLRLNTATGEVKQIQDDGQSWIIGEAVEELGKNNGRYCLSETQNMWTFIMLDTYTGKTWQVQYSVKGIEYMFSVPINRYPLAYPTTESKWTNRFQLFATKNMWTFILLDSYQGRLWQVQYSSSDFDNLLCIPINETALVSNVKKSIFTIQPLISMYQFYLVNESNGEVWKFQWSTQGDDYRWIEKFN